MRFRAPAALFVALALAATACGDGGDDVELGDAADDSTEDVVVDGGDDQATARDEGGTLVAALGGEPDKLDPHTTSSSFAFKILENVYDTLVQPGDDLQMEPALAEDWEISDDLLTWTFTLREGVTFHNGAEFTADDVKASYDRIIEEELNNAYRFESVEEVRVVDDRTVEIALSRPTPNLLTQIGAFKGMAIVDADDIEGGFDFDQEANGTGPFELASFTSGQGVELVAFDGYWQDGLPLLDGVDFQFIPEESVKLTNLQSGDVDWIDTVAPERIEQLEGDDQVEVGRVAGNDYWYMATNIAREPFSDVDVRRAIAFALDPAQVARAAKLDAATPNETAIPETSFWYHEYAPYGQDVEQARQLLEDAGQGDGFSMDLMVTNEFPETVDAAQAIAAQLSEIGIQVEIRTLDFSTWLAEQGEGNFDSFMLGWLGNIDPDDFYYAQHHSEGGFNFHGYDNAEVDELLEDARRETDEDTRKGLYDQVAEVIVDDASYIYFYNPDIVNAWSPAVRGYETRPDNAVRFLETSVGVTGYVVRRVAQSLLALLGVSVVVFALMHLVPGDPVRTALGTRFSPEAYETLRARAGLDRPIVVQYVQWLGGALTGDLGVSFRSGRSVTDVIVQRLPATALLAAASLVVALAIALPAGIISAVRQGKPVDYVATALSQIGVSIPDFWYGIMLILVFSLWLGWLPPSGYVSPLDDPVEFLRRVTMPAVTIGVVTGAILTRFTRSSVLEALNAEHVRLARAKGLPERRILREHVLRNAWIPIVTITGLQLATLLGGIVVVEVVFAWPGLGRLALDAVLTRDYPVMQGAVLLIAASFLLINLLVDLLYARLDPRITYS